MTWWNLLWWPAQGWWTSCGRSAYGDFICVPKTAAQLLAMDQEQSQTGDLAAIDLAVERGARIVGLGAYTSVVTMGVGSSCPTPMWP